MATPTQTAAAKQLSLIDAEIAGLKEKVTLLEAKKASLLQSVEQSVGLPSAKPTRPPSAGRRASPVKVEAAAAAAAAATTETPATVAEAGKPKSQEGKPVEKSKPVEKKQGTEGRASGSKWPEHWGEPPLAQTRDLRELPGGYGKGSGTLAKWIQGNLDKDSAKTTKASAGESKSELPSQHSAFFYTEAVEAGSVPPFVEGTAPVPGFTEGKVSVPAGFALVRVKAASLNPVDKYIAAGAMSSMSPLFGMNRSMGADLAGEIVAVGEGATVATTGKDGAVEERAAKVGDLVFGDGIQGSGTFAQHALVVAKQLALKPESVSFVEAASLPLAGLTALQCFIKQMPEGQTIGKGSKVLVLGGSGGVGSMAIQLAKALGAHVAATSSKPEFIKNLGADVAIDYHKEDWGEKLKGQDYDLIFATVNDAKPTPAATRAAGVLKKGGSFRVLLQSILPDPLPEDGRTYKFFLTDSTAGDDLARIGAWVAEGKVKPVLHEGKIFPFSKEGMDSLMAVSNSGRAKGKLVMEIS
jgi:NADPH:quinone reductase-like Zn-dependent oxidoreductase